MKIKGKKKVIKKVKQKPQPKDEQSAPLPAGIYAFPKAKQLGRKGK